MITKPVELGSVLGVWGHPDDEAYLSAGLMMGAVVSGRKVTCVTATRGEAGFPDDDPRPLAERAAVREAELDACLEYLRFLYGLFGIEPRAELSTRPENKLGTDDEWDFTEGKLIEALEGAGQHDVGPHLGGPGSGQPERHRGGRRGGPATEPAARSAGPAHPPGGRAVRAGHVRGHRGPGAQEADAGRL